MVSSLRSLLTLATVVERHWFPKWPFLLQRKQVASLTGQSWRGWEPLPHCLHLWSTGGLSVEEVVLVCGSFLLGGFLAVVGNEVSAFSLARRASCCVLTASCWRIIRLALFSLYLKSFRECLVQYSHYKPVLNQFVLHLFKFTTICKPVDFSNELFHGFIRQLVSPVKPCTFEDNVLAHLKIVVKLFRDLCIVLPVYGWYPERLLRLPRGSTERYSLAFLVLAMTNRTLTGIVQNLRFHCAEGS